MDISMPAHGWAVASFTYDLNYAGGTWMLESLSTAADEIAIGRGDEFDITVPNRFDFLQTFSNQNGAIIGYIKSPLSRLPAVVNVRNAGLTYLSGIAAGSDGQQIMILMYNSSGGWRMLHEYNSTFCYGCSSASGYLPKLPEGIKPIRLQNAASISYYNSGWASASFVYDAYFNGGTWMLTNWSAIN